MKTTATCSATRPQHEFRIEAAYKARCPAYNNVPVAKPNGFTGLEFPPVYECPGCTTQVFDKKAAVVQPDHRVSTGNPPITEGDVEISAAANPYLLAGGEHLTGGDVSLKN